MDFTNKTKKELEALGFQPFGDSDLMLVPIKRRKQLKGTKVVTIFGEVKPIEAISNDARGGFLACGIYPKDAQQRLILEDWLDDLLCDFAWKRKRNMTKQEQSEFVMDLIDGVKAKILERIDKVPEDWNGVELRHLIADKFMEETRPMTRTDKKNYNNAVITLNL